MDSQEGNFSLYIETLFALLLVGCSNVPAETVELPTAPVSPSPSATTLPATSTPTQQPPTSTWTPLPTLPPEEARARVLSLMENNGGCELPCWWGITPGETTLLDTFRMLTNANVGRVFLFPYDSEPNQVIAKPLIPDEYNPFFFYPSHTYYIQKNKVDLIQVDLADLPHYSLSFLLQQFGVPTEVRIHTVSEPYADGDINFVFYVYYSEIGILAQYDVIGKVFDQKVSGCPQTDPRTVMVLWQPEPGISFENVANRTILTDYVYFEDYPANHLENVTDLTVQEFYDIFDRPDSTFCIESPGNFWPYIELN